MGVCSQVGRRVISRFRLAGPTRAVRRGGSEVGGSVEGAIFEDVGAEVWAEGEDVTKSSSEGPTLRRSRRVIVGRRVGALGSEASVAKEREKGCRTKAADEECGEYRQRSRAVFVAIFTATQCFIRARRRIGVNDGLSQGQSSEGQSAFGRSRRALD